jgi:AraC-like DNA-binding protein
MGGEPFAGREMGFDINILDRDGKQHLKTVASWAGLFKRNRSNPTEWGTLVLHKDEGRIGIMAILLGALLLAGLVVLLIKNRRADRSMELQISRDDDRVILSVHQIINQELTSPELNINFISEKLKLNAGYLGKYYKKKTGTALLDTIHELRIKEAQKLLKEGSMNVTEIARKLGYSSENYFITKFKKITGTTPKQSSR